MLQLTIAAQLLPALLLLAWLAFRPLASQLGALLQVAALGVILVSLGLVGFWGWPSIWTPWVLLALWAVAGVAALARRLGRAPLWPGLDWPQWLSVLVLAGLGGYFGHLGLDAWRGRTPAPGPVIDLAEPFAEGAFLIGHGGSTATINPHLRVLEPGRGALAERFRGQAYALDILGQDRLGRRADGLQPQNLAAYHIFDQPVLAPCDGTVRRAVDAFPDQPVPERDDVNLAGNHVVLACGDAEIVLAHLRFGSVEVAAGEAVRTGERLGRVGNSGNTTEPHLHIHAQTPGSEQDPLSGEPLQITIEGRYLVRNDRLQLP